MEEIVEKGRDKDGNCLCRHCTQSRKLKEIHAKRDYDALYEFVQEAYNYWLNESADADYQLLALQYIQEEHPEIYEESQRNRWGKQTDG